MDILIDGKKLEYTRGEERTLGEALAAVEQWLEEGGRTLSSVAADGVVIPAEELDAAFRRAIDSLGVVELETRSLEEIRALSKAEMAQQFSALREQLPSILAGLENVALDTQTGRDDKAGSSLSSFADFTARFLSLVEKITRMAETRDTLFTDAAEAHLVREKTARLSSIIKELFEAYEKGDSVLTGDLSEYEAAPLLVEFFDCVEKLLAPKSP